MSKSDSSFVILDKSNELNESFWEKLGNSKHSTPKQKVHLDEYHDEDHDEDHKMQTEESDVLKPVDEHLQDRENTIFSINLGHDLINKSNFYHKASWCKSIVVDENSQVIDLVEQFSREFHSIPEHQIQDLINKILSDQLVKLKVPPKVLFMDHDDFQGTYKKLPTLNFLQDIEDLIDNQNAGEEEKENPEVVAMTLLNQLGQGSDY